MRKRDVIRRTLEWCNRQRAAKGMAPLLDIPRGRKNEGASCPCGAATGLFVGLSTYWDYSGRLRGTPGQPLELPESVKAFVRLFDAGELPQYLELDPDECET
jgi:hypothetical protein